MFLRYQARVTTLLLALFLCSENDAGTKQWQCSKCIDNDFNDVAIKNGVDMIVKCHYEDGSRVCCSCGCSDAINERTDTTITKKMEQTMFTEKLEVVNHTFQKGTFAINAEERSNKNESSVIEADVLGQKKDAAGVDSEDQEFSFTRLRDFCEGTILGKSEPNLESQENNLNKKDTILKGLEIKKSFRESKEKFEQLSSSVIKHETFRQLETVSSDSQFSMESSISTIQEKKNISSINKLKYDLKGNESLKNTNTNLNLPSISKPEVNKSIEVTNDEFAYRLNSGSIIDCVPHDSDFNAIAQDMLQSEVQRREQESEVFTLNKGIGKEIIDQSEGELSDIDRSQIIKDSKTNNPFKKTEESIIKNSYDTKRLEEFNAAKSRFQKFFNNASSDDVKIPKPTNLERRESDVTKTIKEFNRLLSGEDSQDSKRLDSVKEKSVRSRTKMFEQKINSSHDDFMSKKRFDQIYNRFESLEN
ncbi:hypothetical protein COBT_000400 [Conglomerata obtusa]